MNEEKFIILDRDGVINYESPEYIKTVDEWKPIPRSLEAIKKLNEKSYQIIIVTNQSGINRKIINYSDFIKINLKMLKAIEDMGGSIASIIYSPHTPNEKNIFRKPKTGMFEEISRRLKFSLKNCYSIGDSPRDIEASVLSKCKPIGVRTGNGLMIENDNKYKIPIYNDLYDAVTEIINK
jgi:D-glycero-D-manno-heptose 1,7-bisphosphate phosphatase